MSTTITAPLFCFVGSALCHVILMADRGQIKSDSKSVHRGREMEEVNKGVSECERSK